MILDRPTWFSNRILSINRNLFYVGPVIDGWFAISDGLFMVVWWLVLLYIIDIIPIVSHAYKVQEQ